MAENLVKEKYVCRGWRDFPLTAFILVLVSDFVIVSTFIVLNSYALTCPVTVISTGSMQQ